MFLASSSTTIPILRSIRRCFRCSISTDLHPKRRPSSTPHSDVTSLTSLTRPQHLRYTDTPTFNISDKTFSLMLKLVTTGSVWSRSGRKTPNLMLGLKLAGIVVYVQSEANPWCCIGLAIGHWSEIIIPVMEEIFHLQQGNEVTAQETLRPDEMPTLSTSGSEDENTLPADQDDGEDDWSEWEEEEPTPVPESLKRPGKQFLKSISSQYLSEEEEREFRDLLSTEGTTPTVIKTVISVTNRFLNFKKFYEEEYPKHQGFNRKVSTVVLLQHYQPISHFLAVDDLEICICVKR
jgi:hypothetical protein